MTNLSIVIVNYKVKYFLRQCIQSILNSQCDISYHIIVVDNASNDGSVEMLNAFFPQVKVIANQKNLGFSTANNQAFSIVESDDVLILNPDTIIQEDTLQKCHEYIKANPDVAALGVRMIDGQGQFLPESKRGFPTPLNAVWKMLGVNTLFRNSAFFNGYYLGQIDEHETNEVDVLTGAFMWVKMEVLKKIKGFDEDYFMYGEDIELSYQIKNHGYKIVYLPTTSIIHFKGESTKKSSISYLNNFYGAMAIYANKRNYNNGILWKLLLKLGIIMSAAAFVMKRLLGKIIKPFLDLIMLSAIGKSLQMFWGQLYFDNSQYYNSMTVDISMVGLISIIVIMYYLFGQYDRRHNIKHLGYGFFIGALAMISVYSLLPLQLRFSRLVMVVLALISPFVLYITRRIYNAITHRNSAFDLYDNKRIVVVGNSDSCKAVDMIADNYSTSQQIVGHITEDISTSDLGVFEELEDVVKSRNINEVIFCSKDLNSDYILHSMAKLGNKISYKIANDDNKSILGSDSKDKAGEWYALDIAYEINQAFHVRLKRIFDIGFCILLILLLPIMIVLIPKRKLIYPKLFHVLFGKMTWVGYISSDKKLIDLPPLRKAVLELISPDLTQHHSTNLYYARNYSIWLELEMIFKLVFQVKPR